MGFSDDTGRSVTVDGDGAYSVAMQADGKILVRYNPDGSLDKITTCFDGIARYTEDGAAVMLDSSGHIH